MSSSATISPDGLYRYDLIRQWTLGARLALFVMLNPSTADATEDDPTIRRCIGFAKREGCAGVRVVNLYAYRATKPADLWLADDPVGLDNDWMIQTALDMAARTEAPIIAAWGTHPSPHRVYAVKQMPGMERATALGFTKDGHPRHPLYVKGDAPLVSLTAGGTPR